MIWQSVKVSWSSTISLFCAMSRPSPHQGANTCSACTLALTRTKQKVFRFVIFFSCVFLVSFSEFSATPRRNGEWNSKQANQLFERLLGGHRQCEVVRLESDFWPCLVVLILSSSFSDVKRIHLDFCSSKIKPAEQNIEHTHTRRQPGRQQAAAANDAISFSSPVVRRSNVSV